MRKLIALALFGLMFMSGMTKSYAQQDSAKVAEEPKDTISVDNMDPKFYEEEAPKESSNMTMYAVIGGIVVVAGVAFYFIRKKKK